MIKSTIALVLLLFWIPTQAESSASKIRVVTEHLPPYQIADKGQVVSGLAHEVVKGTLDLAGLDVVSEVMPWARAYKLANERPNTLIYSIIRTKERETHFHWLGEIVENFYYIYALKSQIPSKFSQQQDLLKFTAAAPRSWFEKSFLNLMGFRDEGNLIVTNTGEEVWQLLMIGRAQLALFNERVARSQWAKLGLDGRQFHQVFQVSGKRYQIYFAASLGTDEHLVNKLTKSMASFKATKSYQDLLNKY